MSFRDDLNAFAEKIERQAKEVHVRATGEVYGSVINGSPLSGAPGQPVDLGNLRDSWQELHPEALLSEVSTNTEYAQAIEEGQQPPHAREQASATGVQQLLITPGPMTLRSEVGGFHSVKLTRAAWPKIVEHAVQEVVK